MHEPSATIPMIPVRLALRSLADPGIVTAIVVSSPIVSITHALSMILLIIVAASRALVMTTFATSATFATFARILILHTIDFRIQAAIHSTKFIHSAE